MTESRPLFTAHDIPDLFNALPTMFGFRPRESVVAIATQGPRRRMGFRMRLDVPARRHVDIAADMIVEHLRRQGAEGAILLAVTDHQRLVHDLLDAVELRLGDIEPVVVARSDGHRYWVDVPGFPAAGIAYETSDHHLSIVQAVANGQQILPDRQALVDRFAPVAGERRTQMEQVTVAARTRVCGLLGIDSVDMGTDSVDMDTELVGMGEIEPLLHQATTGAGISDAEAAAFSVWVSFDAVRDAVWSRFTRENAEMALDLMMRVATVVVPPYEPAVLSLTAFAAWLNGDGAQALIAAERALAADPDHPMANLILQVVENGVSPLDFPWGDDLRRTG